MQGNFVGVKNGGDDTEVSETFLEAFKNAFGFNDLAASGQVPFNFVVAGFRESPVHFRNKIFHKCFYPQRFGWIAIDGCKFIRRLCICWATQSRETKSDRCSCPQYFFTAVKLDRYEFFPSGW